ncbi:phage head-tail connector protein [Shinella yambaruensis]|uniref:PhiE125 gp8 family phage protein n=1 Tax=Shinella yambaruensis TaxID=415996 RepID=A0ABQ5ZQI8_9HYPH|nr:phage head-tail connector protein [Shinella yambaruensis]MCJ8030018.1 phage head-tail connector protein [Shinella yambaruensis]MCU7984310.1 phage head-tail connector protein [Shinella yambaruensis]GLR55138.1 hypothetical protein GCM10007923_63590 [Shinella yambaruensis]
MWYPSTVIEAPTVEPVTLVEAKDHCGILTDETDFDAQLTRLIKTARAHVEQYCNARWAEQTLACACDGFGDLARLSEGPLKSVTSIVYIDAAGEEQPLPVEVYQANKDGLEPCITLKHGQAWPVIQRRSRVTVTAVFGGGAPDDVRHAMLLHIEDSFMMRENAERGDWTSLDALLCNHRRGA